MSWVRCCGLGRRRGEYRERPLGRHGRARREGHLDQRRAASSVQLCGVHTACRWHLERLACEHRTDLEELPLLGEARWRIVAAGALRIDAEEGGGDDRALRGVRHIILRGHAEAGGPARHDAPLLEDELCHHPVERKVVEEGVVQPPPEGAGVVECGIENIGILGEQVLPERHPVVGPAVVVEQPIDESGPLVGRGVGGEAAGLGVGRWQPHGVEHHAADEAEVIDRRSEIPPHDSDGGPFRSLFDPAGQQIGLGRRQPFASRGHPLVAIVRLHPSQEFAASCITGQDRWATVAAGDRGRGIVETQPTLGPRAAMALQTSAFQQRLDIAEEVDRAVRLPAVLPGRLHKAVHDEGIDWRAHVGVRWQFGWW